MELQLVSFTQAKALKSIGMPVNIQKFCYAGDGNLYYIVNKDFYPAPTLELVAKWLRETKNIHIACFPYKIDSDEETILDGYHFDILNVKSNIFIQGYNCFQYEQALSAGIDKAIEILKLNNDE